MKNWNKIIEFGNSKVNENDFVEIYIVVNKATNEVVRISFFDKSEAIEFATGLTIKENVTYKVIASCAHVC